VLCVIGLLGGCSAKTDTWPRAPVAGTVALNGQPLASGQITFFPIEGVRGPAAGAEIRDGQFALEEATGPVVGKNRVEIRSVQKTGRMVPTPMAVEGETVVKAGELVEEYADVIPKRYNTYSELSTMVREGEVNQLDFQLTTQPAARATR
jgi:hypothetical protein